MCFSAESSLIGFGLAVITSLLLFIENHKILSYYVFSIGFMQLADYLMWIDLDCKKKWNKLANIFAILSLYFQLYSTFLFNNNYFLLGITTLMYIYILISYIHKGLPCSKLSKNNNLQWGFAKNFSNLEKYLFSSYFILLLFYSYIWSENRVRNISDYIYSISIVIILLYSLKTTNSNFVDISDWGSVWCHYSNYLSVFLILVILSKKYLKINYL